MTRSNLEVQDEKLDNGEGFTGDCHCEGEAQSR